ncbi:hypothetical protein BHE90_004830 [Fusarium euwallaceae]|uniref:Heterokaryon incompatibility domain-containing protein n=1 Tax=Fusarium euwallaceae TaxID=1147111 RepID=A0A430LY26_9HYPO|nr:hypothetical protein BHE90_004830 [Fusarium euwallaceae]
MVRIEEFPPFKLCSPCREIFPSADDPAIDDNIQSQIWTNDEGYHFTRTREEVERGAMESCEFCTDIIQNDGAYEKKSSPDRKNEPINQEGGHENDADESDEGSNRSDEKSSEEESLSAESDNSPDYIAMFSEPRADWFPPMEERLEFRIKFHSEDKHLAVYHSNGLLIGHNPASKLIHAQATLAEFGSAETFRAVWQWLDECVDNHPECPGNAPKELPTRLIMVSPLGVESSARLCETLGTTGQYCALSYCWGGDQVHKTTREKYAKYLRELPYEELPKTIRDAFQVARSIGIRYVWIDSLCIVQDEKEDVAREMAKMFQIYFNSCFTISAANALTCRDGFLERLSANETGLFFLPIRIHKNTKGSVLLSREGPYWVMIGAYPQPINDRAWTLQEAMLTPRLLIFTSMDVIWKCQAGFKPDTAEHPRAAHEIHIEYPYGPPNESRWFPALVDCGYNFISIGSNKGRVGDDLEVLQEQWCLLVENYTKRNLTVATDKLPGISAIARLMAPKLKSDYLGGLWRQTLIFDLMWSTLRYPRPEACKSGSPSWSWASVQGSIEYAGRRLVVSAAEVISCSVDLAYPQDPYGAVTGGVLEIRGHLTQVAKEDLYREHGRIDYKMDSIGLSPNLRSCRKKQSPMLWCLTLGYGKEMMRGWFYSLILVKEPGWENRYRRVGFLETSSGWSPDGREDSEKETITIV